MDINRINLRAVATSLLLVLMLPCIEVSAAEPGMEFEPSKTIGQDRLLTGVLELEPNNVDPGEARAIAERLRLYLSREEMFDVLERSRMESILNEQGFQISGACDTEECIIQIGALLGAQKMVAGSVSKVGTLYTLQVRIIDIGSSRIEGTAFRDVSGIEEVLQSATRDCVGDLVRSVQQRMGIEEDPQVVEDPQVIPEQRTQPQTQQTIPGSISTDRNGWIIRMNSGLALTTITSDNIIDQKISGGSATASGISIGRTISPNVVLSFDFWNTTIAGPTIKYDILEVDAEDSYEVSVGGIGFGLTRYFMPGNSYIAAAVLLPKITMPNVATGIDAKTKTGMAFQFTLGKEWNILRGLSIGTASQLVVGSMDDQGPNPSKYKLSALCFQLSVTWQLTQAP